MQSLKTILEASLLDNIDNILDDGDEAPRTLIQEYLKENYNGNWTISEKPNKDGLYEVSSNTNVGVTVKNKKITSLTNDLFIWTNVKGYFDCGDCNSLGSLEGGPKKVGSSFYCDHCNSLKTLKGAPEEVGRDFICRGCRKLESLEGAPKELGGTFSCRQCNSLKTLEGAPKSVNHFYCPECGKKFTEDDVKNVSKIKGDIYC